MINHFPAFHHDDFAGHSEGRKIAEVLGKGSIPHARLLDAI
jgi:hypothetical protein